jgi:hypothetical protein
MVPGDGYLGGATIGGGIAGRRPGPYIYININLKIIIIIYYIYLYSDLFSHLSDKE